MSDSSTVDFSSLSDADLQSAFQKINRDRYPANFAACAREIERRKAGGVAVEKSSGVTTVSDKRKPLRAIAVVYGLGGALGFYNFAAAIAADPSTWRWFQYPMLGLFLFLYGYAIYAGVKLFNLKKEGLSGAAVLASLQLFAVSIAGYGFNFYSGLSFRIGFFSSGFGFRWNMGGNGALILASPDHAFTFAVDLFSIFVLSSLYDFERSPKSRETP